MKFTSVLSNIRGTFQKAEKEKEHLMSLKNKMTENRTFDPSGNETIAACDKRIEELQSLRSDIITYRRIASEHTAETTQTTDKMLEPDMELLFELEQQSSDAYKSTGVYLYAYRMISLCDSYIAFVDDQIEKNQLKKKNVSDEWYSSLLKEADKYQEASYTIDTKLRQWVRSPEILAAASEIEKVSGCFRITPQHFTSAQPLGSPMMLIGSSMIGLDAPQSFYPELKNTFGRNFDEDSGAVYCPRGFRTDAGVNITAEYTDLNRDELFSGIRALIINCLRMYGASDLRISVIDQVHYNASAVSVFFPLIGKKNSLIASIPQTSEECSRAVKELESYYHNIDRKLGSSDILEYNRSCGDSRKIPHRIVICVSENSGMSEKLTFLKNNLARFGIVLIELFLRERGTKDTKDEKNYLIKKKSVFSIISDNDGGFYMSCCNDMMPFKWLTYQDGVPSEYLDRIRSELTPKVIGPRYFNRYKMKIPARNSGKRAPVTVPFAISEDDDVISCSFENENFAAYMMGAAGSGKSTLLHTMIAGLMMNYHPDELELWLADFKMVEFKQYTDPVPPHVKYVLLENSHELVFDFIDKLTDQLNRRKMFFSQQGFQNITEIPPDIHIPVIFVIIDEFAQMAQVLKMGEKNGLSYSVLFENLLLQGRNVGIKFLIASQSYSEGLPGLTPSAREQIQMRFALKNTSDEIKATLMLKSGSITPTVESWINNMPKFESLFKWRTDDGTVKLDKFRNMYIESSCLKELNLLLSKSLSPVMKRGDMTENTYLFKKPVIVDGMTPKTFNEQLPAFRRYEKENYIPENEVIVYPGVPRTLDPVLPVTLRRASAENILLVGGESEERTSVLISVLESYRRKGCDTEIWAPPSSQIINRYRGQLCRDHKCITDFAEICSRITELDGNSDNASSTERLIAVIDYDVTASEFSESAAQKPEKTESEMPSLDDLIDEIKAIKDPEERKERARRVKEEYNEKLALYYENLKNAAPKAYDARSDLRRIIKTLPKTGTHFVFCFGDAIDMADSGINNSSFTHKMMFAVPKEQQNNIIGFLKIPRIDKGVFLYTDQKSAVTVHPHIHSGIPLGLWTVDENGKPAVNLGGIL